MNKKVTPAAPVLIALLTISMGFARMAPATQTRTIVENMVAAINKHQGAEFSMNATERIVGKPKDDNHISIFTKVNISPLKIYGKVLIDPNKGTELLYVTGQRDNKIRVNPGKFLPTMTLAPTSGLLTKNQHHTLLTSGFVIVEKIVADGVRRADGRGKFDEVFKYTGDVNYKNRNCYKIVIDDPTFAYTTAIGQKGETVMGLAKRLLISEYHIMDLNPGSRGLDDDISGKTMKVPTSYAKSTVLYIDKENNFPIYQEMSDDRGIFEKYEYVNLIINPPYKADEFSEKFGEYKF